MKEYFSTFIPNETELESFGHWAFGDGLYNIENGIRFLAAWNRLHGDVLILHPSNCIGCDAGKMIKLWRDSLA